MTLQERLKKCRGEVADVLTVMIPKESQSGPIPPDVASAAALLVVSAKLDIISEKLNDIWEAG